MWHEESPWSAKRRAAQNAANDRLVEVRRLLGLVDAGKLSPQKALDRIENVVTERIVRVGKGHKPEIES